MALGNSLDKLDELYRKQIAFRAARDEQLIRSLLGRWVSELEPTVARSPDGEIIGLCAKDSLLGTKPFILRADPHQ